MTPHAARMEETHACEACQDTGRVSNGRSPFDPGYDDGPCPEPDCVEGAAEIAGFWNAREREYARAVDAIDKPAAPVLHPVFDQILAPFSPKEKAA